MSNTLRLSQRDFWKRALSLGTAALVLTSLAHARAQALCSPECPKGYQCQTSLVQVEPLNQSVEVNTCTSTGCASDEDCGQGLICSDSLCLTRHTLPCNVDADCGDGFVCAAECSFDDDTGTCPPLGDRRCYAETQACATDADCRAGWTCARHPLAAHIFNTGTGVERCVSPTPLYLCHPPYEWLLPTGLYWDIQQAYAENRLKQLEQVEYPCEDGGGETNTQSTSSKTPAKSNSSGCTLSVGNTSDSALTLLLFVGAAALSSRRSWRHARSKPCMRRSAPDGTPN